MSVSLGSDEGVQVGEGVAEGSTASVGTTTTGVGVPVQAASRTRKRSRLIFLMRIL
jgi:hypothetical protein